MKSPRNLAIIIALGAVVVCPIWSQSEPEDITKVNIQADAVNDIIRIWWVGKPGSTYFIQHSEDMVIWNWIPVIEAGNGGILEYGFTPHNPPKAFFKLRISTIPTSDPEGDDFDGDGIGNLAEVQQGLSPFKIDSDGDGMADGYELSNGLNPLLDDTHLDLDGDLVANGEDARPNDGNFGRVTVSISAPTDGGTIP